MIPPELECLDEIPSEVDLDNELANIKHFLDSSQKYAKHSRTEESKTVTIESIDIERKLKEKKELFLKKKLLEDEAKAKLATLSQQGRIAEDVIGIKEEGKERNVENQEEIELILTSLDSLKLGES